MRDKYFEDFLKTFKILQKTENKEDFYHLVANLPSHSLKFLIEAAFNILKGRVSLTEEERQESKDFKHLFKKITKKGTSLKKKHLIFIEEPTFTNLIINITLSCLVFPNE